MTFAIIKNPFVRPTRPSLWFPTYENMLAAGAFRESPEGWRPPPRRGTAVQPRLTPQQRYQREIARAVLADRTSRQHPHLLMGRRQFIGLSAAACIAATMPSKARAFFPRGGGAPPSGSAWPGQSGNPVGFAAAPGYPGFLTTTSFSSITGGTSGSPKTYSFLDFNLGTGGANFGSSLSYITFIGCRFQSNDQGNYNVNISGGSHLDFSYCSFTPLASLYTTPPGAAWPAAGVGGTTCTQVVGTNAISGTAGYQYGISVNGTSSGPGTVDHCDFWGMGNDAVQWINSILQWNITECWMHDNADASPNGYHQDGEGYVNGGTAPSNILVSGCTIASIGNTQGVAYQAATSAYSSVVTTDCYVSGYGYTTSWFQPGSSGATNCAATNITMATDIQAIYGPIYSNPTTIFSGNGNTWSGNKLSVYPGSTYNTTVSGGATFTFTSADNGLFIWPDSSLHTTDF